MRRTVTADTKKLVIGSVWAEVEKITEDRENWGTNVVMALS